MGRNSQTGNKTGGDEAGPVCANSTGASLLDRSSMRVHCSSMPDLAALTARIGETYTSPWFTIDQARVNAFADLTLDHNFIHVDVERSKRETPFGGTIAHGFLSVSMLSHLASQCLPAPPPGVTPINYGFDKLRFAAPVPVGARIRGVFRCRSVEERKPGQILTTYDTMVEIEGSKTPALKAEWLTLLLVQNGA